MIDTNLLQGNLQPVQQQTVVPFPRIDQTMLIPKCVKPRHLETNLFGVHFGKDADISTINGSVYPIVFAIDTNKLYCYNGTKFVATTLS